MDVHTYIYIYIHTYIYICVYIGIMGQSMKNSLVDRFHKGVGPILRLLWVDK